MKVTIVFLNERDEGNGDRDFVEQVCKTPELAQEWIKENPLNKKMEKENRKLIIPMWSRRTETFTVKER